MTPDWITAFLDLSPERFHDGAEFWAAVTGYHASEPRGDDGQFVTLLPPTGDPHLRLQRLASGRGRIHLDLHVAAPRSAADAAVSAGAREIADLGHVVLASPGGFPFCFVHSGDGEPAPSVEWPGGHRSQVDQVCLDVPGELYDRELAFWQQVTGRERGASPGFPEFRRLLRPTDQPLQLLVQRLGEPLGEVRAHLDLATDDRAAEAIRHLALGASRISDHADWTVMTDPTGAAYCLTDRRPR